MGYGPDVWGPHGWRFIHFITMGYPDEPTEDDKKTYKKFFELLGSVIPCRICGDHFKSHLKKHPMDDEILKNRESLMAWGVNIHNIVNKMNGKKEYSIEEGITDIIKNNKVCSVIVNNMPSDVPVYMNMILLLFVLLVLYFIIIKISKNK
jgi:hypothetical protein